ncbi:MAG: hypothetical protein ACE5I9_01080 [Candidatus Methylomirabilales bacterium]
MDRNVWQGVQWLGFVAAGLVFLIGVIEEYMQFRIIVLTPGGYNRLAQTFLLFSIAAYCLGRRTGER